MGSQKSSSPCSVKWSGDPSREMGGDGGLGYTRPGGNEVLDVAGFAFFPRGDPRWNDCVSVMVSPISVSEFAALRSSPMEQIADCW